MNKTGHGRWGRYRTTDQGGKEKLCNGPLHPPSGAWLPLRSFWIFKKGPRKGKPLSYCQECTKISKGKNPKTSGLVKISEIWWVFIELERRIGKMETLRRMGVSQNFWFRAEREIYIHMRKTTARKGLKLLLEVRASDEVRHRDSIKHGAAARGHKERIPINKNDFNHPTGDSDLEKRRNWTKSNPEKDRQAQERRKAKREVGKM